MNTTTALAATAMTTTGIPGDGLQLCALCVSLAIFVVLAITGNPRNRSPYPLLATAMQPAARVDAHAHAEHGYCDCCGLSLPTSAVICPHCGVAKRS